VTAYAKEKQIPEKNDTFTWWLARKDKYGRLYEVAMDYLAIQGSSTAAERDFSSAGRIVTKKRAALKSETVEAIFVMKSLNGYVKRLSKKGLTCTTRVF